MAPSFAHCPRMASHLPNVLPRVQRPCQLTRAILTSSGLEVSAVPKPRKVIGIAHQGRSRDDWQTNRDLGQATMERAKILAGEEQCRS